MDTILLIYPLEPGTYGQYSVVLVSNTKNRSEENEIRRDLRICGKITIFTRLP